MDIYLLVSKNNMCSHKWYRSISESSRHSTVTVPQLSNWECDYYALTLSLSRGNARWLSAIKKFSFGQPRCIYSLKLINLAALGLYNPVHIFQTKDVKHSHLETATICRLKLVFPDSSWPPSRNRLKLTCGGGRLPSTVVAGCGYISICTCMRDLYTACIHVATQTCPM